MERGTVSRFAFELNAAALRLGRHFAEGQTQAGRGPVAILSILDLSEFFEHFLMILGRDAAAGIGDANAGISILGGQLNADRAACRGEFDGIAKEVLNNPHSDVRITIREDPSGGQMHRYLALLGQKAQPLDGGMD